MRVPTAVFSLLILGTPACANRGMHAPEPDAGPGAGGTVATAGAGGRGGGAAGRGGSGGTAGGAVGTAGNGGSGAGGTSCAIPADAGAASAGPCTATFNFETDTAGAMINGGSTGFTGVMKSSAFTYCGTGALAINALFSGTSGPSVKGEVLINLPGAPVDLGGKTITLHVAADPGCASDLDLSLVLNTQAGPVYFTSTFPLMKITNSWVTGTATVPAGGAPTALALSLQVFSSATNYHGTIYIDEIDIK